MTRHISFATSTFFAIAVGFATLAALPAKADNHMAADEPLRCLAVSRIDSTTVIGDRRILFKTQRGLYFLNTLPNGCPGLRRNTPFMYRTSIDRLCDIDLITVLDDYGGGLRPAASCALGRFTPISEEMAKELVAGAR